MHSGRRPQTGRELKYWFANWVDSPEGGKEPLLPANDGFLYLSDFGPSARWGLFRVWLADDEPATQGLEAVPDDLAVLLDSGMAYPPALASREDMKRRWHGGNPSRKEFALSLVDALTQRLRAQPHAPYRLAQAVVDELGYLSRGQYVWVLSYDPGPSTVSWVSSDYFIYKNPADDFDLHEAALATLVRE